MYIVRTANQSNFDCFEDRFAEVVYELHHLGVMVPAV